MPATSLLSDTYDVVRGIDLLEGIVIDLRDVAAKHAKFFERLGLLGTFCEIRFKLLFERSTPHDVRRRSSHVESATLIWMFCCFER